MAKYLVIVESPAKVKTVKKYLGANYEVAASMGHVRDLPKSRLGIDVEHDFEPKYITIRGKGELLASLRKAAKKADKVYLATDPDREGEAISWHLATALKLDEKKMRRITFNEITKSAVKESIKHARDIDMNLVDEQQTRRILDRMVGYRISPVLWKKIKRGLSAGRVQSVALRIIADREEEINAFIPEEYWTLDTILKVKGEKRPLTAKFYGTVDKKITIHSEEEMNQILIQNYNAVVHKNDTVYILGDISHHLPMDRANELISRLNGKKILIKGNHDKKDDLELFEEICDFKTVSLNGLYFALMHYPMLSWPKKNSGSIQLHGHIHAHEEYNLQNKADGIRRYDAGVDANNYYPVSVKQIIEFFENNEGKCKL